jgi:hypothetical protein
MWECSPKGVCGEGTSTSELCWLLSHAKPSHNRLWEHGYLNITPGASSEGPPIQQNRPAAFSSRRKPNSDLTSRPKSLSEVGVTWKTLVALWVGLSANVLRLIEFKHSYRPSALLFYKNDFKLFIPAP